MAGLFNENIIKGKWREIKGDLQKTWGRLTDDELESAKGDMNRFTGVVQRKYGLGQEELRQKLNDVIGKYDDQNMEDETEH